MEPEAALPLQVGLDKAMERIDQEMARAMAGYDEARQQVADHHGAMQAGAARHAKQAAKLRPALESVVLGGAPAGTGLEKQAESYRGHLRAAQQCRTAARLCYGATQP